MADITSRDFQELIKRQIETNVKLQALVDQGVSDDTATERALDALPEILNDTRLYNKREALDRKEGLFNIDEFQEKTKDEIEIRIKASAKKSLFFQFSEIKMDKTQIKITNPIKPFDTQKVRNIL